MKLKSLLLALALLPALQAAEPEPYKLAVGDSLEQAKAVLGAPRGNVTNGDTTTYFFAAGEVVFRDGKMIACDLKSTAEIAEAARVAETMRRESADRNEKARQERLTKGERMRQERSKDPVFLAQPPAQRLASWREFRVQYPEIDVQAEIDSAYKEWQVEGTEKQLAELKAKVALLMNQLATRDREVTEIRADRDAWKQRFDDLNSRPANVIVNQGGSYPRVIYPTPTPAPSTQVVVVPGSTPAKKPAPAVPTPVPTPAPAAPAN